VKKKVFAGAVVSVAVALGAGVANAAQIHVDVPPNLVGTPISPNADLNGIADRMANDYAKKLNEGAVPAGAFYEGFGKPVMFYGETVHVADPLHQVYDALSFYGPVGGIQIVPPGPLGGVARCGSGSLGTTPAAICAWADNGSVALVFWPDTAVPAAAIGLPAARGEIEHVR
jgi:hypothetical protein